MTRSVAEVLEFVRENDVKFVRLAFCDLQGSLKNISIPADELETAFARGVSFDAHAIQGFGDACRSDLFLYPDPDSVTVLPWRPGPGRVIRFFCDIRHADGTPFWGDARRLLREAEERCRNQGLLCEIGSECEFYLFQTDERGEPTKLTLDKGGYFDTPPLDKGENIRREICGCLEEAGIRPESSHHEQGPGQNEIDFRFDRAGAAADRLLTFKATVKSVAFRNGLFASFMPKPLEDCPGNGLHVNLSLTENGRNLFAFMDEPDGKARAFVAGVLARIREMTAFLNPLPNSYERFGEFSAPKYVSWSHQNRSQLIRIPAVTDSRRARMELRSPDPALNPYLGFALIIHAGLDGIEQGLPLPEPKDADLFRRPEEAKGLNRLPENLTQAVDLAAQSAFVRKHLPAELLRSYTELKRAEDEEYRGTVNKTRFADTRWFPVI